MKTPFCCLCAVALDLVFLVACTLLVSGCYDRMEGSSVVNTLNTPVVIVARTDQRRFVTNVIAPSTHFVWTSEQGRSPFRIDLLEVEDKSGRKIGSVSITNDHNLRAAFGKHIAFAVYPDTVCPIGQRFFREFADKRKRSEEFPDYFRRGKIEIVKFYEEYKRSL